MIKKIIISLILIIATNSVANAAIKISDKYKPNNLSKNTSFEEYNDDTINAYLQFFAGKLIQLAGPLAVLMIIVAGLWLATSRGDSSGQIEEGRKKLTYAIAGLLVIIVSYVIVQTVITIVLEVDG